MKSLHRPGLFGWSAFDAPRNVDFNGVAWVGPEGVVLVDPMPMDSHDLAHLRSLGDVSWIIVTNSDHVRATTDLVTLTGAKVAGPAAEQEGFPIPCDAWLGDQDELVPGLVAVALDGSKTPGELALVVGGHTLITGDLVRAHQAGRLMMLPDPKLKDRAAAVASVQRLADLPGIEAVLVGDGWPVFRDGSQRLKDLVETLTVAD
jgi:hypothetical protein